MCASCVAQVQQPGFDLVKLTNLFLSKNSKTKLKFLILQQNPHRCKGIQVLAQELVDSEYKRARGAEPVFLIDFWPGQRERERSLHAVLSSSILGGGFYLLLSIFFWLSFLLFTIDLWRLNKLASLLGASFFWGLLALPEVFDRRKWRKEEGTTRSSRTSRALSSSFPTPTWSKRERERSRLDEDELRDVMFGQSGQQNLDTFDIWELSPLFFQGSSDVVPTLSLSLALCV